MYRKDSQKGFTLIEMLITLFILSFVLVQFFDIFNFNYSTLNNEVKKSEVREEFRIISSFLLEDLMYSEEITIMNGTTYDSISYKRIDGEIETIKFIDNEGAYIVKNNKDVFLSSGSRFKPNEPMVYEHEGLIVFNFYLKDINVLLNYKIMKRID